MPMLLFPPAEPHSLMQYSKGPATEVSVKGFSTQAMPNTLTMARKILTRPTIIRKS